MSYFSRTQEQFSHLLKNAQNRVSIFCSAFDEGFWHEKTNGYPFKKSLIDRLNTFIKKRDVTLDIIYRPDQSYLELFKNVEQSEKTTFIALTDTDFIKPLAGLSESFIIVDKQNTFVSSNHESDTGVYSDSSLRATFLLALFGQLMRHEFEKKQGRLFSHTYLPLEKMPQAQENINNLMHHHNHPIQTLRRHNPFIQNMIKNHKPKQI